MKLRTPFCEAKASRHMHFMASPTRQVLLPWQSGRVHRRMRAACSTSATRQQTLWIETSSQAVLTAAVESGHDTVVFGPGADAEVRAKGPSTMAGNAVAWSCGRAVGTARRVTALCPRAAGRALAIRCPLQPAMGGQRRRNQGRRRCAGGSAGVSFGTRHLDQARANGYHAGVSCT